MVGGEGGEPDTKPLAPEPMQAVQFPPYREIQAAFPLHAAAAWEPDTQRNSQVRTSIISARPPLSVRLVHSALRVHC
jgi:hypothetical protein